MSRQASNVEAAANEMLYGCGGTRLKRFNRAKSGESVPFLLLLYFYFSFLVGSFSLHWGQCHIQVWGGETSVLVCVVYSF
ncbi:hypothetical protein HanXRQr2_Chr09g0381701 [Helianthus annuus]|uniref:Uncharacterized protein n=1 Tax=Helianthus annuus TaxID=4232 RepID=A0A9K3N7U7_HELAN|nr:hypothetical protein HanXRQr2_Chr09g0381701 [Helianthus annuus]